MQYDDTPVGPTHITTCFFFFFFSSRRRHTRSDRDWSSDVCSSDLLPGAPSGARSTAGRRRLCHWRSEEHTSELQSRSDLVCRLLLENKKKNSHSTPGLHRSQRPQSAPTLPLSR